mmetsp:Transcript_75772/g.201013  ORF Transcript_75772/g.201013 Transcript_75772/m.201013 type:complete len:243 (+) Transcript_75772:293-1021(+)
MQTNCASGGWASNRFFEPRSRPAMAWRPPRSPTWTSCGGMFLNIRQSRHGRRPAAGSSGASRSPRGWRRRGRCGRRRAACSSAGKAQLSFQVREAGSRCTAWARRRLACAAHAARWSTASGSPSIRRRSARTASTRSFSAASRASAVARCRRRSTASRRTRAAKGTAVPIPRLGSSASRAMTRSCCRRTAWQRSWTGRPRPTGFCWFLQRPRASSRSYGGVRAWIESAATVTSPSSAPRSWS